MPTVTEAGPVTRSVAPVFWSPWPRWDMRGSPTLPILLGFLEEHWVQLEWVKGVGDVTQVWSAPTPWKPRLLRQGVHVHIQCGVSALALRLGALDSAVLKWGDLARMPHTVCGLVQMNSWLLILLGRKNVQFFQHQNLKILSRKKIPTERQFSGKVC